MGELTDLLFKAINDPHKRFAQEQIEKLTYQLEQVEAEIKDFETTLHSLKWLANFANQHSIAYSLVYRFQVAKFVSDFVVFDANARDIQNAMLRHLRENRDSIVSALDYFFSQNGTIPIIITQNP